MLVSTRIHALFFFFFLGITPTLAQEGEKTKMKGRSFIPQGKEEYGKDFFEMHTQNQPVYKVLVQEMFELLPRKAMSVVDVGCGNGYLVEAWRSATPFVRCYGMEGSSNAQEYWPTAFRDQYYQIVDLTTPTAMDRIPRADVVTSFEVAEHIPPSHADHFVQLLTRHKPQIVFFGAATPGQDGGMNPSHVNENTQKYWIQMFRKHGYSIDMTRTARYRYKLTNQKTYAYHFPRAWWYLKNTLVFLPQEHQSTIDKNLASFPKHVNMADEAFMTLGQGSAADSLWRRDWTEFASLFYAEQKKAKERWYHSINASDL